MPSSVAARKASPAAVSATPIHSRRVTSSPNSREPTTVTSTRPPAITDWTSEIGASASAATWKPHDVVATTQPIVYTGERNSAIVLATGRRHSTAGAATAPRYLRKKPITDMSAVTKAISSPSWTENGKPPRVGVLHCSG